MTSDSPSERERYAEWESRNDGRFDGDSNERREAFSAGWQARAATEDAVRTWDGNPDTAAEQAAEASCPPADPVAGMCAYLSELAGGIYQRQEIAHAFSEAAALLRATASERDHVRAQAIANCDKWKRAHDEAALAKQAAEARADAAEKERDHLRICDREANDAWREACLRADAAERALDQCRGLLRQSVEDVAPLRERVERLRACVKEADAYITALDDAPLAYATARQINALSALRVARREVGDEPTATKQHGAFDRYGEHKDRP